MSEIACRARIAASSAARASSLLPPDQRQAGQGKPQFPRVEVHKATIPRTSGACRIPCYGTCMNGLPDPLDLFGMDLARQVMRDVLDSDREPPPGHVTLQTTTANYVCTRNDDPLHPSNIARPFDSQWAFHVLRGVSAAYRKHAAQRGLPYFEPRLGWIDFADTGRVWTRHEQDDDHSPDLDLRAALVLWRRLVDKGGRVPVRVSSGLRR